MKLLLVLLSPFIFKFGYPQKVFIKEGNITFERKENMYFLLKNDPNFEQYRKTNPQFAVAVFDLIFDQASSIYFNVTSKESTNSVTGGNKKTFHDLNKCRFISQKEAYGQHFLLDDSCSAIKWKLVNEKRIIAGFECKRANAILMDSLYVVAFYTEDITPSIGPETFYGLPGAILGVVLPHKHVSWFASKVNVQNVDKSQLFAPASGQKITGHQLMENLRLKIGSTDLYLEYFLTLLIL